MFSELKQKCTAPFMYSFSNTIHVKLLLIVLALYFDMPKDTA